ncbi:MAG TPA: hypothetical protein VNA32_03735 [Actinomycetota bacterium]|nr:hypothetical protein [Actinomycetota bacterium]
MEITHGTLTPGELYHVEYECRDIGYGAVSGEDHFVYRGIEGGGKHVFEQGDSTIYLFEDEITAASGVAYTVLEHEQGGLEIWDCEAFGPWKLVAGPFAGPEGRAQASAAYRLLAEARA